MVEHIKHIYEEGELDETTTCRKFRQVQTEGNRSVERELPFYNLDMIISLGYLDFAERQAERHAPMTMQAWASHLDSILTATGEQLLEGAVRISHEQAVEEAQAEYVKYQTRTLSDVEKQYLASLKTAESAVKKRKKK